MELRTIEQFLQLSKTEHMAETADFFNISQPSLSKSIARLEDELGIKLFDRVGRHIKLNKNGENFASYAEKAFQLLQEGVASAKGAQYDILGRIRIRCRAFGPILSDCITAYSALNPQVEFAICYQASSSQNLQEPEEDFILCGAREWHDLERQSQIWVGQRLFAEQAYVVASAASPWLQGVEPKRLEDFREAPFIVQVQQDVFFSDATYQHCQQAGFIPKILFRTDNFMVKMSLVNRGAAAAMIPESCLEYARMLVPDLLAVPVQSGPDRPEDRQIVMLHRQEAFMTEPAADFWEFLLDYYQVKPEENGAV